MNIAPIFSDGVDIQAQFALNQTRTEDITMREDYGMRFVPEAFGDIGFDTAEIMRDGDNGSYMFGESFSDMTRDGRFVRHSTTMEIDAPLKDDGFGGQLGQNLMCE